MRYYNLTIKPINGEKITFFMNEHNPNATAIEFKLNMMGMVNETIGEITLYNIPVYHFSQAVYYEGATITLSASIKSDPRTRRIGYSRYDDRSDLIFRGICTNTVPYYNYGVDNKVVFYISHFELKDNPPKIYHKTKKGKDETQAILSKFKTLLGKSGAEVDVQRGVRLIPRFTATQIETQSYRKLIKWVKDNYKVEFVATPVGWTIVNLENKKDRPRVSLKQQDLLSQPIWHGWAELEVTTWLMPWVLVNSIIDLQAEFGASISLDTNALRSYHQEMDKFMIITGEYTVKSVLHVGKSNNIDALSWATTIKAIPNVSRIKKS